MRRVRKNSTSGRQAVSYYAASGSREGYGKTEADEPNPHLVERPAVITASARQLTYDRVQEFYCRGARGRESCFQLVHKNHQLIDFSDDSGLFGERWEGNPNSLKNSKINILLRCRRSKLFKVFLCCTDEILKVANG